MSPLRYPIKDSLKDPFDEPALQRMWGDIDARLAPRPPERGRRQRRGWALFVAVPVAAAAIAAGFFIYVGRDRGPLRTAAGEGLVAVDAPASGVRLSLSDGSSIQLFSGARLEPVESSGQMFIAVLARGRAEFDVRPGGPRRWQIECGLATVEVLGTQFGCDREPGRLRVQVERGAVLVRGERLPDRVRRLAAGESMEVAEPEVTGASAGGPAGALPPAVPATAVLPEAVLPPAVAAGDAGAALPGGAVSGGSSWRELARRGHNREAFAALGPQKFQWEAARLGVADLFALADVARLSGHPADAVGPLQRILTRFATDPQASLAAFALGRLELDTLHHPDRAAEALERALSLGIPRSLREDVRVRLVDAYRRAGDRARAGAAGAAYLREFPTGRYRQAIESRESSESPESRLDGR